MTCSSSGALSTVSMSSAMSTIRSSFAPRVVMAGVPRRKPLVWKAERDAKAKAALRCFAQVIPAILIVVAMEFAAFEKKITLIQGWPADVCHILAGLACLWMGFAAGRVWRKAYALQAE